MRADVFVGRDDYLRRLTDLLADVRATGQGNILSVRGRRRVGKSRLLEEWLRREGAPHVFFAASRQPPERELALFSEEVARSSLPSAATIATGVSFESWEAALTYLGSMAAASTPAAPIVVVLDEFPYLLEQEPALEATIQKV